MAKYTVEVTRISSVTKIVEIDAPNDDAARERAEEWGCGEYFDHSEGNVEWETEIKSSSDDEERECDICCNVMRTRMVDDACGHGLHEELYCPICGE